MSTTELRATDTPEAIDAPRPRTETVGWSPDTAPWATSSVRKTALFRETAAGWVLQHVRTVTVSQRAVSECTIDTEPDLADVPAYALEQLPAAAREDLEVSARA